MGPSSASACNRHVGGLRGYPLCARTYLLDSQAIAREHALKRASTVMLTYPARRCIRTRQHRGSTLRGGDTQHTQHTLFIKQE